MFGRAGLVLATGMLLIMLFSSSCVPRQDFDSRLQSIVDPYRFSVAGWEFREVTQAVSEWLSRQPEIIDDEVRVIEDYFLIVDRIIILKSEIGGISDGSRTGDMVSLKTELNELQAQRAARDKTVEGTIGRQVREVLSEQGIYNPLVDSEFRFPPLIFKLVRPPYLLVISPRDRIESLREILLQPSISREEMASIEAATDKLGVSSLVVELGGLAVYPSIVTNDAGRRFITDTVVEEWLHQYLIFKPLGFRYLLDLSGIVRDYEIATINETVAGIVSKEISGMVDKKYYSEDENQPPSVTKPDFDFNREMREIRRTVDKYLDRGDIELAEEFMEQKRQFLAAKGYYIRKLNQAYFAFHGAYADRPVSISPIGDELRELRERSVSLKDFLETVAAISHRQELSEILRDGEPVP